jgi:hypothetical protein
MAMKLSQKQWEELQKKMAQPGGQSTPEAKKSQNIKTSYTPTGPVYKKKIPQEDQRELRRKLREDQKPSTRNTIKKIGRAMSKAIGIADPAVQRSGKRLIASQDREVPRIRRDARETDQRVRRKIAPNIDMSDSWVLSPTPSAGWLTGSRGLWSTSSPPSVSTVFGVPTSLPLSAAKMKPVTKRKTKKKKSRR